MSDSNWLNLYAPVVDGILPDALVARLKAAYYTRPDRKDSLVLRGISVTRFIVHLFIVTLRFDWRRFRW